MVDGGFGADSLGEVLGRGGFAVVHAVVGAPSLVIKVAHRRSEISAARFDREARALAAVGQPWVPRLEGVGRLADGRSYVVMERIRGETLAERIARRGPLGDAPEAAGFARALFASLDAIAAAKIIHRDLKPSNILCEGDRVVLIDFGLARARADLRLTRTNLRPGSRAYMSPEQLRGEPLSFASDRFSAGVILYEVVHGELPFDVDESGGRADQLLHRPRRPRARSRYDPLIRRLLAKTPGDRPSTAAAREALETLGSPRPRVSTRSVAAPPESVESPVVLLAVDSRDRSLTEISRIIERHRGFVATFDDGLAVAAHDAARSPSPLRDASRAARAFTDAGHRVAMHIAPLQIRRRRGRPPKARGPALGDLGWVELPEPGSVAVSAELAASAPSLQSDLRGDRAPLVGRAAAIESLERALEASSAGRPHLVTAIGDVGSGKTRFLAEARKRAVAAGFEVVDVDGQVAPVLDLSAVLDRTALLIDDADQLATESLDAIEGAMAGAEGRALYIAVAADPRLLRTRPGWAQSADHPISVELGPLDEAAAVELASVLLAPVEYPPRTALVQIYQWSRGNPRAIGKCVELLRQRGGVVVPGGGRAPQLATEALDSLPSSVEEMWGARHALASLPTDFTQMVELMSIFPDEFSGAELDALIDALEDRGEDVTRLDASAALAELVVSGWVSPHASGYRLSSAATKTVVHDQLEPRRKRAYHLAALELAVVAGRDDRVAAHAAECGRPELAAGAAMAVARAARARFDHVATEQWANRAVELAAEPKTRAAALLARGRARYHFLRTDEARADLAEAAELAERLEDSALSVEARLELATACDWAWDHAAAAAETERAAGLHSAAHPPRLGALLRIAEGRERCRASDIDAGLPRLREAVELAIAAPDAEAEVVARVLLSLTLAQAGELTAAQRAYEQTIALCERLGDSVHLGVALNNRGLLWHALNEVERHVADMRRAAEIGRVSGLPAIEWASTHNLAELLYFNRERDEALLVARRSYRVAARVYGATPATAPLLVARILCAMDRQAEARELLDEAGDLLASEAAPPLLVLHEALSDPDIERWDALFDRADEVMSDAEAVEVYAIAARADASRLDKLRERVPAAWVDRFDKLI